MFTHIHEDDVQNFRILYSKLKENFFLVGDGHVSALQILRLAKVATSHANISALFIEKNSKFSAYLLHVAAYWKNNQMCSM